MRISDWSSDVCSSDLEPLALLGGQPPAAAVGAGLERDAFGLRLQEVPTERPTGEASLQVVDLELVGVAFVFFGEQQAIVVRIAPDRLDHAQRSEEHTSELQSLMRISYAVFCLKKKKKNANYKSQSQE